MQRRDSGEDRVAVDKKAGKRRSCICREREREREREIDAHTHTHTHRIKGGAVSVRGCLRTYETHALKEAVGDLRP
jgi:hypothetical protein